MLNKSFLVSVLTLIGSNSLAQLTTHKILTPYGLREYKLFRPEGIQPNSPTVVAIHGCKQTGDTFARGARLYEAAKKFRFNLLLPEQDPATNPYNCWNWFLDINQRRLGEPSIIVESIHHAKSKYALDESKLYLLGMSSGAAMSNILMNCYPKLFKAVASHSGIPYAATVNPLMAQAVLERGMFISPYLAAQKGLLCGKYAKTKVPALIIQGSEDEVVAPVHAKDLSTQYTTYNSFSYQELSLEESAIERADGYHYQVKTWHDRNQKTIVKELLIENLKHEWSGGDQTLPYNQSAGPDSTKMILNFFQEFGL
ncbi:PHB depolymerase family esterase [Halobacteriovorax sp. JY17]|uniref:extracellular catalytic domain type 1 short-chain-length polyhydroxyalkanoate depolymerase n=1 Tax=Halobacteriovorax sp. JY17 TaxID=2014617 RepID=UPI000C6545B3|nr:PHB depolymerase family esterase [Halobacteriovorax sp. JY17]PIK15649.1 MAG: hypothetical protein CES88_02675 [Halobacteriovorax sp. JY17]